MIGTVITQVTGNDVDSGPALSYSLHLDTDTQGLFGIHRYGGGVSLTGSLDYEERTWFTLTIRTSDSKHQSEANLTVLVDDVNDNAPTFTQDSYQVNTHSWIQGQDYRNWIDNPNLKVRFVQNDIMGYQIFIKVLCIEHTNAWATQKKNKKQKGTTYAPLGLKSRTFCM